MRKKKNETVETESKGEAQRAENKKEKTRAEIRKLSRQHPKNA